MIMSIEFNVKRGLLTAALGVVALTSSAAHAYTISFDGQAGGSAANGDAVALANGVTFASGMLKDIYDNDWNIVGERWTADPSVSALVVDNPAALGYGSTPSLANALDARFDQVLMQFSAPLQLASFSFAADNSSYGFPGPMQLQFLDANGVRIATSAPFIQAGTTSFIADFSTAPLTVSGVLLPAGKFYDDLTVTVSAVPEPGTTALLASGLILLAGAARRQKKR